MKLRISTNGKGYVFQRRFWFIWCTYGKDHSKNDKPSFFPVDKYFQYDSLQKAEAAMEAYIDEKNSKKWRVVKTYTDDSLKQG